MWQLERKRALITGAGSGIGRSLACELSARQVHLCLVDRDARSLEETARLCQSSDVLITTLCIDLTSPDVLPQIVSHLQTEFGGLDLLINNAGIVYYGSFDQMMPAQLDQLMAINLTVPIELTHACLPLLLSNRRAHVLNVGSMYAFFPTRRAAAYHASKAGLLSYSLALRTEYARFGLGVTCLTPGFIRTNLFENMLRPDDRPKGRPPDWITASSDHVARRAIKAIEHNRRLVPVTWLAWLAWLNSASWPKLIDWLHSWERKRIHDYCIEHEQTPPEPIADSAAIK